MNKEQYEASKIILKLSEVFVNQIRNTMVRTGLIDDGYKFRIDIFPSYEVSEGCFLKDTIDITNGKCAESFCKFNYRGEGWKTLYEPEINAGTADAECKRDPESEEDGAGTETEKPLAPDGLWISSADDTDYVQDWRFDVT